MRNFILIVTFLGLAFGVQAQEMSKAEKKAAKKIEKENQQKEQEMIDMKLYDQALAAIVQNQWAFESDRLTDSNGMPIQAGTNRPNVAGFDGTRFFADIIYVETIEYRGQRETFYRVLEFDSNAKVEKSKLDKKGNHVFKFISYPPTPANVTLILYKDTNKASITISGPTTVNYIGKVIPIKESWYFITPK